MGLDDNLGFGVGVVVEISKQEEEHQANGGYLDEIVVKCHEIIIFELETNDFIGKIRE